MRNYLTHVLRGRRTIMVSQYGKAQGRITYKRDCVVSIQLLRLVSDGQAVGRDRNLFNSRVSHCSMKMLTICLFFFLFFVAK